MSAPQDPDLERLERELREGLRAPPLPPAALERMRATVEAQWRSATAAPPAAAAGSGVTARHASRPILRWAMAAAVLAVGVAIGWWRPLQERPILGSVLRLEGAGIERRSPLFGHARPGVGEAVRAGDVIVAQGAAVLALAQSGTLRLAAGSTLEVTGQTAVELRHGALFVDLPPTPTPRQQFRVLTRAGAIEHLGTAFEVLSREGLTRVRVREGRVRWFVAGGPVVAVTGTELSIAGSGGVSRREIPTYGSEWAWVESLAPDFEIEGRSLTEFLSAIGRELGRSVEFADPHAREVAERTILHGSLRAHQPIEALDNILATTSLTYELRGDAIRVHSSPMKDSNTR